MIIFMMASFIEEEISLAVIDKIAGRAQGLLAHKVCSGYYSILWRFNHYMLQVNRLPKCFQIIAPSLSIHF